MLTKNIDPGREPLQDKMSRLTKISVRILTEKYQSQSNRST